MQQGYNQQPMPQQGYNQQQGFQQQGYNQQQQMPNVVIVNNQPQGMSVRPPQREFSSGLCACCEDCESCLCGFFCEFCYTFCVVYPRHRESCAYGFCCPFGIPMLRAKHRARHSIQGSLFNDACMGVCCSSCSMCQLKRDMDFVERQGLEIF